MRRNGSCLLSLLALTTSLAFICADAVAQGLPGSNVIPANRLIRWEAGKTVGVPGGIPSDRVKCETAACQAVENASPDLRSGAVNAAPLIQAAIASAMPNTVVMVPAGRWRIDATLNVGATKDSITVRGAGAATLIDCRSNICFNVGAGTNWSWPTSGNSVTALSPDVTTGGTVVTLADTSAFSVNQLVHYEVANDRSLPVVSVAGFDNMRRQISRVVRKTASSVTVFPSIYGFERLAGLAGKLHVAQLQTDFVGIEDLVIDGASGRVTFAVHFGLTYGSWVKNVNVIHSSNYSVHFYDSLNCELRRSRLDELNHAGSNGAGLLMDTVSGCLIEDNIIRESFPGIEVNHGSSGNVIAYNFVHNNNGTIGIDINHGPHNSFNLYEGNVTNNLISDGYFGGNSEDTLYRNLLHGNGVDPAASLSFCLSLKRFTRNLSVVGNVIGSARHTGRCDAYGQPNIGNGSWSGTAQPSVGKYWSDWRPDSGTTIRGTLTGRTDNFHGVVTLSSGKLISGQAPALRSSTGATLYSWVRVGAVAERNVEVDSSPWQVNLPPLNTGLSIEPGPGGFQELDLDVEATTLKSGNNYVPTGIPAAESLAGKTLSPSLYRTAKPAWFGQLTWPAFDPAAPNVSYEAIPAGYRYVHGVDPPGVAGVSGGTSLAPSGLRIVP